MSATHENEKTTFSLSSGTADISVLNQLIDDEDGAYRIKWGDRIVYLSIPTDVFDEDTMCRPYLLIPQLPTFPQGPWTRMHITRNAHNGSLDVVTTDEPLPAIRSTWHPQYIDVLALEETKCYRSNVYEVVYHGESAIAKIAPFDWNIPRIENETWVYSIMDEYQRQHPHERQIFPRFLGHLTENDRVIGLLLEKVDGTYASIEDLSGCEAALRQFHKVDLIHGDVNRYNFLVEKESGRVKLVDFEYAEAYEESKARMEIDSLGSELCEQTGRGWTTVTITPGYLRQQKDQE